MYQGKELSVLAHSNNYTHWHYNTPIADDVMTEGYFNGASNMLRAGDTMIINQDNKTFMRTVKVCYEGHVEIGKLED